MTKANKQTKENKVVEQANKGEQTMKETVATFDQVVLDNINKAVEMDANIRVQKVTGYISVKYGNKVLFEYHAKKRSISHLTFSQKQTIFKFLKESKLIQRVVPASYGWKYDTECLLTKQLADNMPRIMESVIADAIAERNLKDKELEKKAEKQAKKSA